jgi:hypothetical protein
MTLHGIYTLEAKERHNDDDEMNTDILDEAIVAPNYDNNYHEPQPQNLIPTISCVLVIDRYNNLHAF